MRLSVLVLLGALLVTGCGSDGLSKADYVTQAEASCRSANDRLAALLAPTTPAEFLPFFDKALTIVEGTAKDLERLKAPSEDADDLEAKLIGPLQKQAQSLREATPAVKEALASKDPGTALEQLGDPTEKAGPEAKADGEFLQAYGLTQCSQLAA